MSEAINQVNNLLSELGQAVGVDGLALEDDGNCQLVIDNAFAVNVGINDKNENLVLFSNAGEIHNQRREKTMQLLLQANRFWVETGGATISLDDGGKQVLLAYQRPLKNLTFVEFNPLLEWFVNLTQAWRERLAEIFKGQGDASGWDEEKEDKSDQTPGAGIRV